MEQEKKKKKNKSCLPLPSNYVTIADLQERWLEKEKKKKSHLPLPSNYVTIADLQQRWLKQQNQTNQQQHQETQQTNETVSRSHSSPKNHEYSGTNSRAIEVAVEDHRKSETVAGIGDEIGESSKEEEKKKKKGRKWKSKPKPKPKVEEKGASEERDKITIEGEKITIKSELNEKKSVDSRTVEKVEQKFRVLSMNSRNGKRNGRFQSQGNYYGDRGNGNRHGGHGHFSGQHSKVQMLRSEKMVWVRKDNGNVGGTES